MTHVRPEPRVRAAVVAALCALVVPSVVTAEPIAPIGAGFEIGGELENHVGQPASAALDDPGFVVTWSTGEVPSQGVRYGELYYRLFDLHGNALPAAVANTATAGIVDQSSVARLEDGNFVVTWRHARWNDSGPDPSQIRARIFDRLGTPRTPELTLGAGTPEGRQTPDVVALPGGGFAVAWGGSARFDVWIGIFDATGAATHAPVRLTSSDERRWAFTPAIAASEDQLLVVWSEMRTLDAAHEILARRVGFDGNLLGPAERLERGSAFVYLQNPDVAALASGEFVALWDREVDRFLDTQAKGISGVLVGADGRAGPTRLDPDGPFVGDYPEVAVRPGGDFVVAWRGRDPDRLARYRHFGSDGRPIGAATPVPDTADERFDRATTAAGSSGELLIAYQVERITDNRDDDRIFARGFAGAGGCGSLSPTPAGPAALLPGLVALALSRHRRRER